MLSCINDTAVYLSIELESILLPTWLVSISSQETPTLLIFSASTGDILKFGQDSKHYSFGWQIQMIFMIEELPHFE